MWFRIRRVFFVPIFVVLIILKDVESIRKHDGGWFYTDPKKCQIRCDKWYGKFRKAGTEDELQSVSKGKIYVGFKCICHSSREIRAAIEALYNFKESKRYRRMHFFGFGNYIKRRYKKVEFIGSEWYKPKKMN
nr:PREDICTED: uncharacterized protein LOC109042402 [Bemisia tabaci]